MTPEDTDFIKRVGNSILLYAADLIAQTLLYGIFFTLFCISTVISIRKGLTNRTQWMMLITSIVCFALYSSYLALDAVNVITFVKSVLVYNITLPGVNNISRYNIRGFIPKLVGEVIAESFPIISDIVVVWRAWVIFPSQRRWMIGPIVFLVCTVVITTLHLLSYYHHVPALLYNENGVEILLNASTSASIATNLTATLLISYNLWHHRKYVSGDLGYQKSRSQGEKILAVLVESGAAYCVIQVVILVLQITTPDEHPATNYAYSIFTAVYLGASAMYPVTVVVLVRLQLSFEHTYGFSIVSQAQAHEHKNASRPSTIGQLRFASTPSGSIINQENEDILEGNQNKEFNV